MGRGPREAVPPDETDEQLMRRFQRGDAGAFEVLVRRHRSPVFSFLLRLTGDRARAEDLCQEAFLRAIRGADGWEPRARFTGWLYRIARNLVLDEARRDEHRRAGPLDPPGGGSPPRDPPAAGPGPDEAAAAAELRPRLEAALASLPVEQREVFLLREHSGLSFPEIAEATGVNENTVKSRMRYALLALRERLATLGVEPGDGPARSAAS
jgi:RNA polymerase sigma-70 factor (ECF subfamily)